jgi:hypothetical protein
MNRYLAALLVVVGVLGLLGVMAVGRGFADEEKATGAKCSEATLDGTYLFAQNGVEIKGNDQRPFAIAGYDVFDGNGKVKGVASGNFNGQTFRNEPLSGTYTVKANCTGTFTFTDGSCVPTPSLCRRVLKCGGVPSEWESEPLKHIGPGLLAAPALPLLTLMHRSA